MTASEHLTDRALDALDEIFFAFNAKGQLLQWNRRVNEVTGYSDEEIGSMHPTEFVVADEVALIVRHMEKVLEEGHTRFEAHFRTKAGHIIPYEFTGSLFEHDGEPIICGTGRDIAERRQVERELRDSEEKFRRLAEHALVGIYLYRHDGYAYVNPKYAEIFGYTVDEMISGKRFKDIVHPDDWPRAKENVRRRLAGEDLFIQYRFRGVKKCGDVVHLEAFGTRIIYQEAPAIIGTLLDITDRQNLQREILKVQEEEQRRIGQELHDGLSAHLSGTKMLLHLLVSDVRAGRPIDAEDLGNVEDLIGQAIDDARLLSHGLNPVMVGEEGLAQSLKRLATDTEMRTDIPCTFDIDDDVPALIGEEAIHLYRIAQEATNNAVKHAHPSHICIRLSGGGETITLSICDDGIGISEELKADDGIGLHSMQYRSNLIGGTFCLQEVPGGGTHVSCRLPLGR